MEKIFFGQNPFPAIFYSIPMTTKPRGGGVGLSGRTTKKRTFFAASLRSKANWWSWLKAEVIYNDVRKLAIEKVRKRDIHRAGEPVIHCQYFCRHS